MFVSKGKVLVVMQSEDYMILCCVLLTRNSTETDRQTDGGLYSNKDAFNITQCRA